MMSLCFFGNRPRLNIYICVGAFVLFTGGCSVAEPVAKATPGEQKQVNIAEPAKEVADAGAKIPIEPNGPAFTVRAFYHLLREKKFREAIFLTDLKPAIESLNDNELKEFAVDFESIAGQVPAQLEINGEIVTGDVATVTVNLPKDQGSEKEVQPIKLKKENDVWVIISADGAAGKKIRKEGKNYFYKLRIETHQDDAKEMLESISKAEVAYALKNGAAYTDIDTLVGSGYLPADVKSSDSTGYNFELTLIQEKNRYTATATPAVYGKTGNLSFLLYLDNKGRSHVTGKDTGGQPLRK